MPVPKKNTPDKSKKIIINVNVNSSKELWEGPLEKMEASKIPKTEQYLFNTLEDAKKEAEILGSKYDSITKDGKKYKIRQTKLIDTHPKRTLWIRKSAKKNLNFKKT